MAMNLNFWSINCHITLSEIMTRPMSPHEQITVFPEYLQFVRAGVGNSETHTLEITNNTSLQFNPCILLLENTCRFRFFPTRFVLQPWSTKQVDVCLMAEGHNNEHQNDEFAYLKAGEVSKKIWIRVVSSEGRSRKLSSEYSFQNQAIIKHFIPQRFDLVSHRKSNAFSDRQVRCVSETKLSYFSSDREILNLTSESNHGPRHTYAPMSQEQQIASPVDMSQQRNQLIIRQNRQIGYFQCECQKLLTVLTGRESQIARLLELHHTECQQIKTKHRMEVELLSKQLSEKDEEINDLVDAAVRKQSLIDQLRQQSQFSISRDQSEIEKYLEAAYNSCKHQNEILEAQNRDLSIENRRIKQKYEKMIGQLKQQTKQLGDLVTQLHQQKKEITSSNYSPQVNEELQQLVNSEGTGEVQHNSDDQLLSQQQQIQRLNAAIDKQRQTRHWAQKQYRQCKKQGQKLEQKHAKSMEKLMQQKMAISERLSMAEEEICKKAAKEHQLGKSSTAQKRQPHHNQVNNEETMFCDSAQRNMEVQLRTLRQYKQYIQKYIPTLAGIAGISLKGQSHDQLNGDNMNATGKYGHASGIGNVYGVLSFFKELEKHINSMKNRDIKALQYDERIEGLQKKLKQFEQEEKLRKLPCDPNVLVFIREEMKSQFRNMGETIRTVEEKYRIIKKRVYEQCKAQIEHAIETDIDRNQQHNSARIERVLQRLVETLSNSAHQQAILTKETRLKNLARKKNQELQSRLDRSTKWHECDHEPPKSSEWFQAEASSLTIRAENKRLQQQIELLALKLSDTEEGLEKARHALSLHESETLAAKKQMLKLAIQKEQCLVEREELHRGQTVHLRDTACQTERDLTANRDRMLGLLERISGLQ